VTERTRAMFRVPEHRFCIFEFNPKQTVLTRFDLSHKGRANLAVGCILPPPLSQRWKRCAIKINGNRRGRRMVC